MMLHTNIKALGPVVSDKKSLPCVHYINLCKTCDPQERGNYWPRGDNLNKLGRGPLGDATYQISRV